MLKLLLLALLFSPLSSQSCQDLNAGRHSNTTTGKNKPKRSGII
ncbi:hypothetical protein PATA110616_06285 [Paenibacillus tarimensis]